MNQIIRAAVGAVLREVATWAVKAADRVHPEGAGGAGPVLPPKQ